MNQFEMILEKYKEFANYLDSIEVSEFRNNHSRSELKEFANQISEVKIRSLSYEIRKMTDEMKLEEYPELLGVHNFPVLKEISFLTEDQKKKLDDYLVGFRKGNYLSGLWRITSKDEKVKKIEEFLLEKGIVVEQFVVQCPNCSDEYLSKFMSKEEKEELDNILKKEPSWERYEELEGKLNSYCDECSFEFNLEKLTGVYYKKFLKVNKSRDNSLDNV